MRVRILSTVVVFALASMLSAQAPSEERVLVVKTPKMIMSSATSVVIEGRWLLKGRRNPDFSLARLNSSYISCSKAAKMCEETVAELRTPGDGEGLGISAGELLATCHIYEVTEWTDKFLVAISRKAVADLVIRVDLKSQKAERLFREREDPAQYSSYTLE